MREVARKRAQRKEVLAESQQPPPPQQQQQQQSFALSQMIESFESNNNSNSKGDTWQEEAFRSSLLDLLGSFPANFFDYQDENQRTIFASESIDDESPHSTTQKAASSQLNCKQLFDAASRSLA